MNEPDIIDLLDEWDPDWRDHYGTLESAECNYQRAQEAACRRHTS